MQVGKDQALPPLRGGPLPLEPRAASLFRPAFSSLTRFADYLTPRHFLFSLTQPIVTHHTIPLQSVIDHPGQSAGKQSITKLHLQQTELRAAARISLKAPVKCCSRGSEQSAHFLQDESVSRQSAHNVVKQQYRRKAGKQISGDYPQSVKRILYVYL